MKAAPFTYIRPGSLEETLAALAAHGGDGKPIAGGQSLVPMMAMRLARPAVLIDINRLAELKGVSVSPAAAVTGATVRQCDAEAHTPLLAAVPLMREALRWVGHVQTRNRGTLGGSIAHADPVAELPLVAAVLNATMVLRREGGERRVAARDFFIAPFVTAAAEDECLVAVEWPVWLGASCAFEELAIRHGDFAIASAACQLSFGADGAVARAAFGLGGVGGTPFAFPDLAARLLGRRVTPALVEEVARDAAARSEPGSDTQADAAYRRHLAAVLLRRALLRAAGAAPAMAA